VTPLGSAQTGLMEAGRSQGSEASLHKQFTLDSRDLSTETSGSGDTCLEIGRFSGPEVAAVIGQSTAEKN